MNTKEQLAKTLRSAGASMNPRRRLFLAGLVSFLVGSLVACVGAPRPEEPCQDALVLANESTSTFVTCPDARQSFHMWYEKVFCVCREPSGSPAVR